MKTGRDIPCDFCGKVVYLPLWRLRRGKLHFCSLACQLQWLHEENRRTFPIQCLQCGETFFVAQHELKTAKFCQRECVSKWRTENLRGRHNWRYGTHHTEKTRQRIKASNLANWENPDFVRQMVKSWARRPTKPEKQLETILNKHFPQFQYNGDGNLGITLGGLTPDFVNVNGKKEVIELFGDHYHSPETLGDRWRGSELGKIMVYNSVGYRCLVIWASQLKDEQAMVAKIKQFMKHK